MLHALKSYRNTLVLVDLNLRTSDFERVFFQKNSCCKKLHPFLAPPNNWHLRFTNNRRGDVELGPCRDFILGRKERPILANSLVALRWEKGTQPKWI